jgi:hypothetical protein
VTIERLLIKKKDIIASTGAASAPIITPALTLIITLIITSTAVSLTVS